MNLIKRLFKMDIENDSPIAEEPGAGEYPPLSFEFLALLRRKLKGRASDVRDLDRLFYYLKEYGLDEYVTDGYRRHGIYSYEEYEYLLLDNSFAESIRAARVRGVFLSAINSLWTKLDQAKYVAKKEKSIPDPTKSQV